MVALVAVTLPGTSAQAAARAATSDAANRSAFMFLPFTPLSMRRARHAAVSAACGAYYECCSGCSFAMTLAKSAKGEPSARSAPAVFPGASTATTMASATRAAIDAVRAFMHLTCADAVSRRFLLRAALLRMQPLLERC